MTTAFDSCFSTNDKMIPLDDARARIHQHIKPLVKTITVSLKEAMGKILAQDIIAKTQVPPFSNSAMDGYAVRFSDLGKENATTLKLSMRITAGHPSDQPLEMGCAARIFTGALIPEGADSVIMQENATEQGNSVFFPIGALKKAGTNVRLAGEDINVGDVILNKGHKLRAADIGVCASIGITELEVYSPLKVAIFSTGDEIREPNQNLEKGQVYDINRYTLFAMLTSLGCEVSDLGILEDDPEIIQSALETASENHDLIFTSGGVSLGEEDHVKTALKNLGELHFWRIAIKPGRPIALGQIKDTPFIGLPGNPVATLVTFMTIARPMIMGFSGKRQKDVMRYSLPANFDYSHKGGRYEWQRAYLKEQDGQLCVELFHTTGSGVMTSMVKTDGLVEIPDHAHEIKKGDFVRFIPYSEVSQ